MKWFVIFGLGLLFYGIWLLIKKRESFFDFFGNCLIAAAGFAFAWATLTKEFRKAEIDERYHECNVLLMMHKEIERKMIEFNTLAVLISHIDSSLTVRKLDGFQRKEVIAQSMWFALQHFSNDFRYEVFYNPNEAKLFTPGLFYVIDSVVTQIQYLEDLISLNRSFTEQYRELSSNLQEIRGTKPFISLGLYFDPRVYLRDEVSIFFEVFKRKSRQLRKDTTELHEIIDNRFKEIYEEYPEVPIQATGE